jgi:hypothetical protein
VEAKIVLAGLLSTATRGLPSREIHLCSVGHCVMFSPGSGGILGALGGIAPGVSPRKRESLYF